MITFLSLVILGFFLGMRHATDPDHVVAVTTIVSRERSVRKAAMVGAAWGVGHSLTVVLVGGAIIVFGIVVPERLGLSLEFTVAIMLVGLGLWNLGSFLRSVDATTAHARAHAQGIPHSHAESPFRTESVSPLNTPAQRVLRPLGIGVVHGLAGSAAVALMVLPLIRNPWWAAEYLLIFGLGTVAGMMLITMAIALPFKWSARRSEKFHDRLGQLAAAGSLGFGLFLMYRIGFVQGLFHR
jgi:ABC-type nickel/cobalt efflux system permease component RcnA